MARFVASGRVIFWWTRTLSTIWAPILCTGFRLLPGDPARLIAGARATPEALAAVRDKLGLDAPVVQQFLHYVGQIGRGDFGRSIISRRPISEDILIYVPATLELVFYAAVLSLIGGITLGSIAAAYAKRGPDVVVRAGR
jgi:ABC-type dipeptide/oligopeptide/nickel transport system permease component